ncbi:MAG: uracil-DNA glycosylase [Alphaproteobacteria bacterium]|nr:uracil-DNA glycosylase [Alphaproteobacteria bacterium]
MDIKRKLYWLMQAGVSCFCSESPQKSVSSERPTEVSACAQATLTASKAKDLPALNSDKESFGLSSLKKTAAHTIFGQGLAKPTLMCIMETPDTDSDRSGQTLAGPLGEQFGKMMTAIHLDTSKDVYVTYLSPWRTPGNRTLTEAERALFLPFLVREIQLVRPQKILLFGAGVAQALLNIDSLAKARGKWHKWENIPVRTTLAISSLKATPQRRQAWEDLQAVEKE